MVAAFLTLGWALFKILRQIRTVDSGTFDAGRDATLVVSAARDTALLACAARAQNSLDANMNMLRAMLHAHGEPRLSGGELYFGDRLINNDFQARSS